MKSIHLGKNVLKGDSITGWRKKRYGAGGSEITEGFTPKNAFTFRKNGGLPKLIRGGHLRGEGGKREGPGFGTKPEGNPERELLASGRAGGDSEGRETSSAIGEWD